jgi:hypothetical protein
MELPPNLDLSRFVNHLKTTSSRLVRRDLADQLNYASGPVPIASSRVAERRQQYVERQAAPP